MEPAKQFPTSLAKTEDEDKNAGSSSTSRADECTLIDIGEVDLQQNSKRKSKEEQPLAHLISKRMKGMKDDENISPESDKSEQEAGDAKDSENDLICFSDSVFAYLNKGMSDHGNVFEGEIRSAVYGIRPCAIKLSRNSQQAYEEARILNHLGSHTHIVSIIQSGKCEDLFEEVVYIALDKCHKQNLHQYITEGNDHDVSFNSNQALQFCKQIIAGVTYVHEKLIIHKDLKPSNILLTHDKSTTKIADFGLSQEIKSTTSKSYCKHQFGTNGFRPVESQGNDWVSLRSDVFSLGAITYFMLSNGKSPFGHEISIWMHNTIHEEIDLSGLQVPNQTTFKHLLKLMLSKDRCRRPSIWQVSEHPCWTGKEVDPNFDYGNAEEVGENAEFEGDEEIRRIREQHSRDYQSLRLLSEALEKMGHRTLSDREVSFIILDELTSRLQRLNLKNTSSIAQSHEFNSEMKSNSSLSAISLGEYIYILVQPSLYRIKHSDEKATWEKLADLDGNHGTEPQVFVASEFIYIAGAGPGRYSKAVSRFNTSCMRWEKLHDKQLFTNFATIAALKDCIYCIGGYAKGIGETVRVEMLDASSQLSRWNYIESMNEARSYASAAESNGNIFVTGGWGRGHVSLCSAEKYDPTMDQWTTLKPMTRCRVKFRCFSIGKDALYAVGGDRDRQTMEIYEIRRDEWRPLKIPNMQIMDSVLVP